MIFVENITINGKEYVRTYSDTYTITRDGAEYDEAIDPVGSGRMYVETQKLRYPAEDEGENFI